MRQRLDIADGEARTKIRAKYLRALENEEFGMLPGSTFVRTFLRTYAELLGLDPQLLVEEYRSNYEPGNELELQPLAGAPGGGGGGRRERGPRPRPSGPRNPLPIIGGAVVVILVFLLILGLTGGNDNGGKQAAKTNTEKTK